MRRKTQSAANSRGWLIIEEREGWRARTAASSRTSHLSIRCERGTDARSVRHTAFRLASSSAPRRAHRTVLVHCIATSSAQSILASVFLQHQPFVLAPLSQCARSLYRSPLLELASAQFCSNLFDARHSTHSTVIQDFHRELQMLRTTLPFTFPPS